MGKRSDWQSYRLRRKREARKLKSGKTYKPILPDYHVSRSRTGDGWEVLDRMRVAATGFDSYEEAQEWIEGNKP